MILLCHNTLAKSYDSKVGLIIQKRCILVTVFAAASLPILLYFSLPVTSSAHKFGDSTFITYKHSIQPFRSAAGKCNTHFPPLMGGETFSSLVSCSCFSLFVIYATINGLHIYYDPCFLFSAVFGVLFIKKELRLLWDQPQL